MTLKKITKVFICNLLDLKCSFKVLNPALCNSLNRFYSFTFDKLNHMNFSERFNQEINVKEID